MIVSALQFPEGAMYVKHHNAVAENGANIVSLHECYMVAHTLIDFSAKTTCFFFGIKTFVLFCARAESDVNQEEFVQD